MHAEEGAHRVGDLSKGWQSIQGWDGVQGERLGEEESPLSLLPASTSVWLLRDTCVCYLNVLESPSLPDLVQPAACRSVWLCSLTFPFQLVVCFREGVSGVGRLV